MRARPTSGLGVAVDDVAGVTGLIGTSSTPGPGTGLSGTAAEGTAGVDPGFGPEVGAGAALGVVAGAGCVGLAAGVAAGAAGATVPGAVANQTHHNGDARHCTS